MISEATQLLPLASSYPHQPAAIPNHRLLSQVHVVPLRSENDSFEQRKHVFLASQGPVRMWERVWDNI